VSSDVDTAAVAALIANRARCAMLDVPFDGGERTAGSLAKVARVAPSTPSGHLRMLADGGLVVLESRGRQQYVRLAGPAVAHALEALSTIASTSLRASDRVLALRQARTCYDHLAGALGVALIDALCAQDILTTGELHLTPHGARGLQDFGINVTQLRTASRPLTRVCLDWSEKRPHLAGRARSRSVS
jgi:DNA-binding transcriptional ArsR family regulator